MPKPLRISPIALDSTNRMVLKVAVDLINDDGIDCVLLPDNSPEGQLLVIDADNEAGRQILTESSDEQVKLVLSQQRPQGKNLIWQEPPVRVIDMKEQLALICQPMQIAAATHKDSEPAPVKATPESGAKRQKNEMPTLQASAVESPVVKSPVIKKGPASGAASEKKTEQKTPGQNLFLTLFTAKQEKTCYQITFDGQRLLVGGHNGTVAVKNDQDSKTILTIPAEQLRIQQIDAVAFAEDAQELHISALDNLLWQAGVDHSGGRLLKGHNVEQAVRLKAWPNFTRNGFRQSHFKLAAIMARQPISLTDLRKQSGVLQRDIVSFYNAAYAVGLIDRTATTPDSAAQNPRPRTRRKGLIGMLARKLGFR